MATINGDNRNNTLVGTNRADVMDGKGGDDTVSGRDGADDLRGSAGFDRLFGERGNDTLTGGLDDDLMVGGPGTDTASYEQVGTPLVLSLTEGTAFSAAVGTDTLDEIENVRGTKQGDGIAGDDGPNVIRGLGGNDSGNFTVDGEFVSGLEGRLGDDIIYGDDGNDWLYGDSAQERTVTGGNDRLYGGAGDDHLLGDPGNDFYYGEAGNDLILAGSTDPEDDFHFNSGNDVAYGGDGNDEMGAGDGDDRLFGDAGADLLAGGRDNDRLTGGSGRDRFEYVIDFNSIASDYGLEDRGQDLALDFTKGQDQLYVAVIDNEIGLPRVSGLDLLDSTGNGVVNDADDFAFTTTIRVDGQNRSALVLDVGAAAAEFFPDKSAEFGIGAPNVDTLAVIGVNSLRQEDFYVGPTGSQIT
jgi:Ca2+-binding RTX toxin-like protein